MYVLLGELIETIKDTVSDKPVPFFIGVFIARALAVLADPTHFMYGKINRFLNKGPPWNISKVPSYWVEKVLLHQPEDDDAHEKEVEWLLITMMDGLRTEEVMPPDLSNPTTPEADSQ